MDQFDDLTRFYLSCSSMPVCFCLLNEARIYINDSIDIHRDQVITKLINHIGTITTKDFQIEVNDLYKPVESYMEIDSNILVDILWNYSSHFLNVLYPYYRSSSSIEQEKILQSLDIEVVQGWLNHIAERRRLEKSFTKTELFERIYDLQKQKQKVLREC